MALFLSGMAALINQVIWQRALGVFLGGCETISSMIVVLVFMAGLGFGSLWMGRRSGRFRDPARAFALIELVLAGVNLAICGLLASDLSTSLFAVQRLAMSSGLPLLLLYALGATIVLIIPCWLMGATMPFAAEVCQRSLGLTNTSVLGWLFFINTVGSVLGTVLASGYLMPHFGQTPSLVIAALANGLAGIAVLIARRALPILQASSSEPASEARSWRLNRDALMALGLGFCSLSYEMYLFRLIAWKHQPLPYTFAAVVTGFLVFWSLGAAFSARTTRLSLSAGLRLAALGVAFSIPMYAIDNLGVLFDPLKIFVFVILRFPYFLPCFLFGYLFSRVAAGAAKRWGADVGHIYFWNTVGSCSGILLTTLVGFEMPFFLLPLIIALLLYVLQEGLAKARTTRRAWVMPLGGAVVVSVLGLTLDLSTVISGVRMFSGRDGVIGINDDGDMIWDGLWHSRLSVDGNHVGTNNWMAAACPVTCHDGDIRRVCIIGVATGITATTLAKLDTVEQVDGYDITRTLKEVYRAYPEGTLGVATHPKINMIWQDARSGLALHSDRLYDVIQTQPLYLKQAGSALLNSREFYELVSKRLAPGGVFCLYSNGTPAQAYAVRQTAAAVFPYRVSFLNGYLLVLSNDPIDMTETTLRQRFSRNDPLWDEIRSFPATSSAEAILRLTDDASLGWGDGRMIITDGHPIVEHPVYLENLMSELGYPPVRIVDVAGALNRVLP